MSLIRCQVQFKGRSNLPEDRFVNTFHFQGTPGASYSTIASALASFYNDSTGSPPGPIAQYMSEWILRDQAEFRFYDMTQGEPRTPTVINWVLGPRTESTFVQDLPEECAVVCSFAGSAPVTARRRGRIYLGPLNTLSKSDATLTAPSRVDTWFLNALTTRSAALRTTLDAAGIDWVVWSPTNQSSVPVVSGWADNAFDTQRRRGPKPSTRTTWTSVLP